MARHHARAGGQLENATPARHGDVPHQIARVIFKQQRHQVAVVILDDGSGKEVFRS